MDNERVPTKCEYMMEHIIDEINYWKNRRKNKNLCSHSLYKLKTFILLNKYIFVDTLIRVLLNVYQKIRFFFNIINWFIFTIVTNLRFITILLSYKSVDEILTILKQHQSILVHSFNNIVEEIEASNYFI